VCSQSCGPKGLRIRARDGIEGACGGLVCLNDDAFEVEPCNRMCYNGGGIENVNNTDACMCRTGFHGECCEHGFDLTIFVIVYLIIIALCFVFVCSMFCVGEYRHKHVLQALPTTYETEFDDWEEDEPLLEPKFVWTGPHDSKRMGIFHKSWDSYSEYSSRPGSVMSVASFVCDLDPETGEKVYRGHDSVLAKLDIFEIAMLRNFNNLDKATRADLTQKISQRVDFEEQIKLRSFDSLSEEEAMEMMSRLCEIADKADVIKKREREELKDLENNATFQEIDPEIIDMMGRFAELTQEERVRVVEAMSGVLTEKEMIRLMNFDNLSKREQDEMLARMGKLQSVAKKVEVKQKRLRPDYDGNVEMATGAIEGMISKESLNTAVKSEAVSQLLMMLGLKIGSLGHIPDARLDIRSKLLAKLLVMSEEEITALCVLDGLTEEELESMTHTDRLTYLADRASAACVADLAEMENERQEELARLEEEKRRQRELEGRTSSCSSMSGVMSMSSSDDDDDAEPKRKKVDLSKIKWAGPPKGAKPAFRRGQMSIGVLSTSVAKFKEREKTGSIKGRTNVRAGKLSEVFINTNRPHATMHTGMKESLRKRLSKPSGTLPEESDDSDSSR